MNYIFLTIGTKRIEKLSVESKRRLVASTILWSFRKMGAVNYQSTLKEVLKIDATEASRIKEVFAGSGYLMKNIKMAIYYGIVNGTSMAMLSKKFALQKRDRKVVEFGIKDGKVVKEIGTLGNYRALTLKELDKHLSSMYENLEVYTNKFVYRKMSFILKSENMDVSDISGDLLYRGLQSVYFYYPAIDTYPGQVKEGATHAGKMVKADADHATNIARRIIHNRGINVIRYYTTDCRGSMIKTREGHANRKVNIESLVANSDPMYAASNLTIPILASDIEGNKLGGYYGDATSHSSPLDFTLEQLIKSNSDPKWATFIRLLGGKFDKLFTQWLRSIKATAKNNDVYYAHLAASKRSTHYFKLVCDYLNLKPSVKRSYINQISWLCCD